VASSATRTEPQSQSAASGVPVLLSLLAATAGVVSVSAAAALVEQVTASQSVPPFDANGQRFDQTLYSGRLFKMLLQCDPRLLLYTNAQVHLAKERVDRQIGTDRSLWEDKRLCESALNESTGEIVPRPFRMSGYVPYNGPICGAMVASPHTTALLFWSWVNQSQNALVNYYNRNAGAGAMTTATMAQSYAIAVVSALTVAFGLATFIQRRYPPAKAQSLLRYVAFPSAVVASSLNCYIVRSPEITTGIPLLNAAGENVLAHVGCDNDDDDEDNEVTTSRIAAAAGVYTTTASRALLQAPVYFLPPVLLATVPALQRLLAAQPRLTVPLTTYLLLVSFGMGLPATVALFPQMSTIEAHQVEERFQHLRDPTTNQPYKVFYYNKGL
jgi:sideroflexin-5